MYGETLYGRHTAQHQLQWSQIKINLFQMLSGNQWAIENIKGLTALADILFPGRMKKPVL